MSDIYAFVSGPLVWIAFGVFLFGWLGKLAHQIVLAKNKDPEVLIYFDWKFAARSILMWLLPFKARSWRMDPVFTAATFIFHLCLLIVPIFLSAHVILLERAWGINYWTLSDSAADIMTIIVLVCCLFFAFRRWRNPTRRFVGRFQDWLVLVLVAIPFLTGFLAYHQIGPYQPLIILHVLAGEALLMALPFTRFAHVLLAVPMRGYIGSEFGGVRKAKDW
jgi:nitrate reductase gamma subunit